MDNVFLPCTIPVRLELEGHVSSQRMVHKLIQLDGGIPLALVLLGPLLYNGTCRIPKDPQKRHFDCSSSLPTKVLTEASVGLGIATRWVLMVVVFQAGDVEN